MAGWLLAGARADPLEYPHGKIVTRVNIRGKERLTCQHIFHTADDADTLFSFYDATLEASGWNQVTNTCAEAREKGPTEDCGCATSPARPDPATTRLYARDDFLVAVNVQSKPREASLAQLTVMIPGGGEVPFPRLDDGTRLYPYGDMRRFMTWEQQGYVTHMYELVCTDPPPLFRNYMSRLMADNQWVRHPVFLLLDLLPGSNFVMLFEKDVRQISVIATPEKNGQWAYAIFMKNVRKADHV